MSVDESDRSLFPKFRGASKSPVRVQADTGTGTFGSEVFPPAGPGDITGKWHEAISYQFTMPSDIQDLLDRYNTGRGLDLIEMVTSIRVDTKLGEGEARICYLAKEDNTEMVAKEFKPHRVDPETTVLSQCLKESEVQTVSAFLADVFEDEVHDRARASPVGQAVIRYAKARTVVFKDENGSEHVLNIEKKLRGSFEKWNNTTGWVNEEGTRQFAGGLLQAFPHWCYVRTGGHLMVCDVQGVRELSMTKAVPSFRLTDPAIHSDFNFNGRRVFGSTDLGKEGMSKFFSTHRCLEECEHLHLEPHSEQPKD